MADHSRRSLLSSLSIILLSGCVSSTVELSGKTSILSAEIYESDNISNPSVRESQDGDFVEMKSIFLSYPCADYNITISPDSGTVTGEGVDISVSTESGSGSSCSVQSKPKPITVKITFETIVGGIPIRVEKPNETLVYVTTGEDNSEQLR